MGEVVVVEERQPIIIAPGADQDAAEIGWLYQSAAKSLVNSQKYLLECGRRLSKKKAELGHGNWLPWLRQNENVLGFKERAARLLIKAAANRQLTADLSERTAAKVSRIIWGNDRVRGTQGTGENEWYTPIEHIELARQVLGTIDVDPASSAQAQKTVKAGLFYTVEDDGLSQDWRGNVWLNPPYAQPHIEHFADKMIAELKACRVKAAIMLTHNYTDTAWFQKLMFVASATCFPKGRIRFEAPDGELASPTQGQAIFFFGPDRTLFVEVFKPLGFIVEPSPLYTMSRTAK